MPRPILISFILILLLSAINTAVRPFGHTVYLYGNIVCLLLIATTIIILSRGVDRLLSILLFGLYSNILIDTVINHVRHTPYGVMTIDANDIAVLSLFAVVPIVYAVRNWPLAKPTIASVFIVTAIMLKAIAQYKYMMLMFDEHSFFEICNTANYFLLAWYILYKTYKYNISVPVFFITITLNDLVDDIAGDQSVLHLNEIIFIVFMVALILLYNLHRYAKRPQTKKLYLHTGIALTLFYILYFLIDLFRY